MVRIMLFAVLLTGMSVYITLSARRLFTFGALRRIPAVLSWLLSALPAAAGLALIPLTGRGATAIVALAHLTALLVLCDVIMWLVRSEKIDKTKWKAVLFAASFVICAGYISFGAVNAFMVTPTRYSVVTAKDIGAEKLRIAQISDCHLGTTFDGTGFARHIEAISAEHPDVLVITGDFVDSRTPRGDMVTACAALEEAHAPLGVYYVPGNHEMRMRPDKLTELYDLLKHRGVTILEDESVTLEGGVVICGRKDAYDRSRLSVGDHMKSMDGTAFTVFLDHQPREYDAYSAHDADLVLSGHTHAGQMFPLGMFIKAIGMGENTYGMEKRGDTSFIVSSGMSGLLPLRTEAKSEYVIIDIISDQ